MGSLPATRLLMGTDSHTIAFNCVTISLDRERIVANLADFRIFEDMTLLTSQTVKESGQIFERMEPRLIGELDTLRRDEWH